MDPAQLTAASFSTQLDTTFRIAAPEGSAVDLRLSEVDPLPAQRNAPRVEPFSLVFVGPASPRLDQRTYVVAHAVLGELEIFLVPIGFDSADGGRRYEAVFN